MGLRGLLVGGTVDIRWVLEAVGCGWVSGRVLVGFSGGCKMGGEWKGGQNERRGGRNEDGVYVGVGGV